MINVYVSVKNFSIMDDPLITCDHIIESYDKETNFSEEKATCKT